MVRPQRCWSMSLCRLGSLIAVNRDQTIAPETLVLCTDFIK